MQDNRLYVFLKEYLMSMNNFLDELEKTNNTKLIFHAQMLYDRLELDLKKNYNT